MSYSVSNFVNYSSEQSASKILPHWNICLSDYDLILPFFLYSFCYFLCLLLFGKIHLLVLIDTVSVCVCVAQWVRHFLCGPLNVFNVFCIMFERLSEHLFKLFRFFQYAVSRFKPLHIQRKNPSEREGDWTSMCILSDEAFSMWLLYNISRFFISSKRGNCVLIVTNQEKTLEWIHILFWGLWIWIYLCVCLWMWVSDCCFWIGCRKRPFKWMWMAHEKRIISDACSAAKRKCRQEKCFHMKTGMW